ncbi:MAG: hypothetical protein C0470_05270 [Verminephrobacter sp.]|nr:hypothetical protein [Verminephrobacter sp.]
MPPETSLALAISTVAQLTSSVAGGIRTCLRSSQTSAPLIFTRTKPASETSKTWSGNAMSLTFRVAGSVLPSASG